MLRPENLQLIYDSFPVECLDDGSLKWIDFTNPDHNAITTLMLIEAERFWAATLLQLLASQELGKVWLHTWSDVTIYYASFFSMNALMRLAGRSVTFSRINKKTYRIKRTGPNSRSHDFTNAGTDHRQQWEWYYDLIRGNVTDDSLLREIFDTQLDFDHEEREMRQMINYDLEYGYDERHYNYDEEAGGAHGGISMYPFENTDEALGFDEFTEIAIIIYSWKHTKNLFNHIADHTPFARYWKLQKEKLNHFVSRAPLIPELRSWAIRELS